MKAYGEDEAQIYKSFSSPLDEVKWLLHATVALHPGKRLPVSVQQEIVSAPDSV